MRDTALEDDFPVSGLAHWMDGGLGPSSKRIWRQWAQNSPSTRSPHLSFPEDHGHTFPFGFLQDV
ncbi:unnamed protein product, partial [Gulo gulo]